MGTETPQVPHDDVQVAAAKVTEESHIDHEGEIYVDVGEAPSCFSFKKLWLYTGPGWLMSIAYLDPGNLESDLQAGATGGYSLLWVLWWATMGGLALQILAARLGVVTGRNLAQTARLQYNPVTRLVVWFMTEAAIIGSDIQEVVGSAIALQILFPKLPLWAGVLITGLDTLTFMAMECFGIRKMEAIFGLLIFVMTVCFITELFIARPDPLKIAKGLVIPSLDTKNNDIVQQAVAMIGAVIMPHNIYLHSALVQTRRVDRNRPTHVKEANKYFAIESSVALLVSFVINMSILAVFAHKFLGMKVGLDSASEVLAEYLNDYAKYIWAVGLLAAGQSSTMTGTYAGQYVMEGFLNIKMKAWQRICMTRGFALVPSVMVAVAGERWSFDMDQLSQWMNVLQSVVLPFALIPVLRFTASKALMGKFQNNIIATIMCWLIAALVVVTNFYLVYGIVTSDGGSFIRTWWGISMLVIVSLVYLLFLAIIVFNPIKDVHPLPSFTPAEDDMKKSLLADYDPLETSHDVTASPSTGPVHEEKKD